MSEWYVNVNRNTVDSNRKHGVLTPPLRVQKGKYGKAKPAHEVLLPEGSRLVYDAEGGKILPCGARVVVVCPSEPQVVR